MKKSKTIVQMTKKELVRHVRRELRKATERDIEREQHMARITKEVADERQYIELRVAYVKAQVAKTENTLRALAYENSDLRKKLKKVGIPHA